MAADQLSLSDDFPMREHLPMSSNPPGTAATLHGCPDCRCRQKQANGTVSDGYQDYERCERGSACGLEIVRPGKVQCWCDTEDRERFKCRRGHYVEPCIVCGEPSQCGELTCVQHTD